MVRISFFILFFSSIMFSQEYNFSGIIRDGSTGEGLAFANVLLENNNIGTAADEKGVFSIKLKSGSYNFIISYISYKTETIRVEIAGQDIFKTIDLVSTNVLLQEVAVYSSNISGKETTSGIAMQNKEIEQISSVFPDVFRSIQALPGLSVNNEFSAKFNVRGGNYDENLVLVNGTQVYEPFHLKEAENASVGIFNLDLMKKVNIITGGFSAEYGDRLSSVLNIEYREGNKEKYKGSVTFSFLNIDGYAEGPISSNLNFIVGVRKSYLKYIMNLLHYAEYVKPDFYDVQGVFTYHFAEINKLQFTFIHAGDDFSYQPGWETQGPFHYNRNWYNQNISFTQSSTKNDFNKSKYFSNMFDLKGSFIMSQKAFLSTTLSYYEQTDKENRTYTENYSQTGQGKDQFFYYSDYNSFNNNHLDIKTLEVKTILDYKIDPYYDIKTGVSFIHIDYLQNHKQMNAQVIKENMSGFPNIRLDTLINPDRLANEVINTGSYKLAGFMENVFQINDNCIVNAGIRGDYFEINRDLTISPRLSASYKVADNTTIRAAWGDYYQSPIYSQLAYSTASDTNTQSQKAVHYNLGIEHSFQTGNNSLRTVTLKADFYYKKYSELISSKRDEYGYLSYSRKNDSKGYAAGVDIYASLKSDWYFGWISYGLLFSKEDYLPDNSGYFPRYSDQRHTLSFINDFNLGKNWSMNLRFAYGSGFAYTPEISVFNSEKNKYEWVDGPVNSKHLAPYKRVDLRISRNFMLFGMQAGAFLDISNLFNFKNVFGYYYHFNSGGLPVAEEIELWPIIPSIGFKINFE